MHEWFKAVQAGQPGLNVDRDSIALLWASFRQLQDRVSYLCAQAASAAGITAMSRQGWKTAMRREIDAQRMPTIPGPMGDRYRQQRREIDSALIKADAKGAPSQEPRRTRRRYLTYGARLPPPPAALYMKAKKAAVWWDEARYRDSELRRSVLQGVKMRWGPAGPPAPRWVKGWSCAKDAHFLEQQRSDMFAAGEAFAAPSQDPEKLLAMGAFI